MRSSAFIRATLSVEYKIRDAYNIVSHIFINLK